MTAISRHSKKRMVERTEGIQSFSEAKRIAKQAWSAGKTINQFCSYPEFASYLRTKQEQSRTCSIRVYRGNLFIWKGKNKTLVTVHPIPNRFLEGMVERI